MLKSVRISKQETLRTGFEMGAHEISGMMGEGNSVSIGAGLQIKTDKDIQETVPTRKYNAQGNPEMETAYLKKGHLGFRLESMDVASGSR